MKIFGHPNWYQILNFFNYSVIDLVEDYNFDIKFVFLGHHMETYEIFL